MSVLASVTARGVLAWNAYDGAVDSERFISFLVDKLLPKVRRCDVLVMDNVRFHKTAEVKRIIKEAGVTLSYIPPYHPELNAAEELFSLFKSGLRRRDARTLATLIEETRDILASVGPKAAGFVRHVLNLANQSLLKSLYVPQSLNPIILRCFILRDSGNMKTPHLSTAIHASRPHQSSSEIKSLRSLEMFPC